MEDSSKENADQDKVKKKLEVEDIDLSDVSHRDLKKVFDASIKVLIENDPILNDLHPQVTLEEVSVWKFVSYSIITTIYITLQFCHFTLQVSIYKIDLEIKTTS